MISYDSHPISEILTNVSKDQTLYEIITFISSKYKTYHNITTLLQDKDEIHSRASKPIKQLSPSDVRKLYHSVYLLAIEYSDNQYTYDMVSRLIKPASLVLKEQQSLFTPPKVEHNQLIYVPQPPCRNAGNMISYISTYDISQKTKLLRESLKKKNHLASNIRPIDRKLNWNVKTIHTKNIQKPKTKYTPPHLR
jgi:hypothetical protein